MYNPNPSTSYVFFPMNDHDILQRFLFEHANVRGEIVRLKATYRAITERHPYPLSVQRLLGEALACTALLSATIKFEGTLILQIQSDGPIHLLVTQINEHFHLRGLAKWHGDNPPDNFAQALGEGRLALTITPHEGERYQGIVSLEGETLSAAVQKYFDQSEQLPTHLFLASNEQFAAGFLLQTTPNHSSSDPDYFWEHVVHLAKTLTADELLSLSNETLLKRLFHEEDVRIFEPATVSFRCECTVERMERALRLYGYEEAQNILLTNKHVTVTCEFCHRHYDFDQVDIERIFRSDVGPSDTSSKTH